MDVRAINSRIEGEKCAKVETSIELGHIEAGKYVKVETDILLPQQSITQKQPVLAINQSQKT